MRQNDLAGRNSPIIDVYNGQLQIDGHLAKEVIVELYTANTPP